MSRQAGKSEDPFQRLERRKGYSRRSQRSWREQIRLEEEMRRCEQLIGYCKKKIAELDGEVKRLAEAASNGHQMHQLRIADVSREKDDKHRELAAYEVHLDSLRSRIRALKYPTSARAARERLAHQVQFGRYASERLAIDRKIGPMLLALGGLLKHRQELSSAMLKEAEAVDLQASADVLDATRFDDLLDSIPQNPQAESEGWAAWFAGEAEAGSNERAADGMLQETLASCGYGRGDRVSRRAERPRVHASRRVAAGCP